MVGRGGEEAAAMAQLHVTLHRAARSLGEMWKGGCFLLPALPIRFMYFLSLSGSGVHGPMKAFKPVRATWLLLAASKMLTEVSLSSRAKGLGGQ